MTDEKMYLRAAKKNRVDVNWSAKFSQQNQPFIINRIKGKKPFPYKTLMSSRALQRVRSKC